MSNNPEGQPGHVFSIAQCEKAHKHARWVSHCPVKPGGLILFICRLQLCIALCKLVNKSVSNKMKSLTNLAEHTTKEMKKQCVCL